MNRCQIFSIALLLTTIPTFLLTANEGRSIETMLRHQQEMSRTQSDVQAVAFYLLSKQAPGSLKPITDRIGKTAVKQLVGNHLVPEGLKEFRVDFPSTGEVSLISEDQLLEVIYAMACMYLEGGASRDKIVGTGVVTMVREWLLQFGSWSVRSLCGDACPMPANVRANWDLRTGMKEVFRYLIDIYNPVKA